MGVQTKLRTPPKRPRARLRKRSETRPATRGWKPKARRIRLRPFKQAGENVKDAFKKTNLGESGLWHLGITPGAISVSAPNSAGQRDDPTMRGITASRKPRNTNVAAPAMSPRPCR